VIIETAQLLMGTEARSPFPVWGSPENTSVCEWIRWADRWGGSCAATTTPPTWRASSRPDHLFVELRG
jgi:hypothetical protein